MSEETRMEWSDVCHWIAQAAINMAEGVHNTFEPGCRPQKAIEELCRLICEGQVVRASSSTTTVTVGIERLESHAWRVYVFGSGSASRRWWARDRLACDDAVRFAHDLYDLLRLFGLNPFLEHGNPEEIAS